MSISSEEAATIRAEQQFLKEQVGQVVEALKENTETTREMLRKMDQHDLREEYRQQEIEGIKDSINTLNEKVETHIESNKPVMDWAASRKEFWDGVKSGFQSNTGKAIFVIMFVAIAMFFGIDLTNIKVG